MRHEIIRASAGTGKTFQLVNRYLRLLFATRAPERIIALTFTRKAAGEFFHKIFHALAEAAAHDSAATALARRLAAPGEPAPALTAAACRDLLRLLLARLHRLRLATYDSFFAGIVQSAPYELGLAGPATLIDEAQRDAARRQAQRALSQLARRDRAVLDDFWHAFKRATMGADAKTVATQLDDYIARHHSLFLDAPATEVWGEPARIWADTSGNPWPETSFDPAAALVTLRAALPLASFNKPQTKAWESLLAELADWPPDAAIPESLAQKAVEKFAPHLDALPRGTATVTMGRATPVPAAAGRVLADLARHALGHVLARRLDATRGLHALLRQFELVYGAATRRSGRLTIEDMTRLLAPPPGEADAALLFARGLPDPELRLALDYRLDARFDHWLLDEFQDTSFAQWRAIANLVDEIIQDASGERSFFAVGDAKQSIYLWRGSDPAIFERLETRYPGRLATSELSRSFRSCPAVLDLVNAVFTARAAHAELLGEPLAARWAAIYQPHIAAEKNAALAGHAAHLLVEPPPESTADERAQARHAAVAALLRAIDPLARGLSVAVLVRENAAADALVEYLRAHTALPCSLAANTLPGQDNALSAALLSFLQLAAHPGDTLAWQHLRLTPLRPALEAAHPSAAAWSAHLLGLAGADGVSALLDRFAALCAPLLPPDDAFNHGRLALARAAARAFDARGDHDLDAFIEHLRQLAQREHDTPGQVAIMTIHKSKGLDWDLVILPDLEGQTLLESPVGLLARRAADGEIRWILNLPSKEFTAADPVLAAAVDDARQEAGYENLCNLYVGLTRAKRALYVLTHPPKETSQSANFPRLLAETLGNSGEELTLGDATFPCAWQSGDPRWFERIEIPATSPAPEPATEPAAQSAPASAPAAARGSGGRSGPVFDRLPPLAPAAFVRTAAPRAYRPSAPPAHALPARVLFRAGADRADFGLRLHAALQTLDWLAPGSAARALQLDAVLASPAVAGDDQLAITLRALLTTPATAALFVRPSGETTELWRETPFEILDARDWISGRFDRVHLHRDATGALTRARIIDFKTDALVDAAALAAATERHRPQLATYRRALARLLGLEESRIHATLIFTSTQPAPKVVEVS